MGAGYNRSQPDRPAQAINPFESLDLLVAARFEGREQLAVPKWFEDPAGRGAPSEIDAGDFRSPTAADDRGLNALATTRSQLSPETR